MSGAVFEQKTCVVRAQDLGRARSEQHVLGLDAVLLGDQLGDFGGGGELIAAELAEAGAHRVEHGLRPGPSGFSLLARMIGECRLRVERASKPRSKRPASRPRPATHSPAAPAPTV